MPAIPIGTITLYYESHGKGDPVVILPDLGNDVTSLWAQVPEFSQEYRCIAIDNRGVGRSSKPSTPYTTKLLATDVIRVLDYLRIERAHFIGLSMGGAVAQEVALNYPERIGKMIILGGWAKPDRYLTSLFEMFRDVKRSVDPLTFDREVALWSFTREYFDSHYDELEKRQRAALDVPYPTPATTFTRQAEACMAHDTFDRLKQVISPTLVIVGEQDILTPRRFSDQLAARIRKAEIAVVDDAAHAAYWEQPAQFNKLVMEYLARPIPTRRRSTASAAAPPLAAASGGIKRAPATPISKLSSKTAVTVSASHTNGKAKTSAAETKAMPEIATKHASNGNSKPKASSPVTKSAPKVAAAAPAKRPVGRPRSATPAVKTPTVAAKNVATKPAPSGGKTRAASPGAKKTVASKGAKPGPKQVTKPAARQASKKPAKAGA